MNTTYFNVDIAFIFMIVIVLFLLILSYIRSSNQNVNKSPKEVTTFCLTNLTAIDILTAMLGSDVSETLEELIIHFDDYSNKEHPDENYYVELTKVLSKLRFLNG